MDTDRGSIAALCAQLKTKRRETTNLAISYSRVPANNFMLYAASSLHLNLTNVASVSQNQTSLGLQDCQVQKPTYPCGKSVSTNVN